MWHSRRDPLTVSHHPTNFGDHKLSVSGDIMVLVFHMTRDWRPRDWRIVWLHEWKLHLFVIILSKLIIIALAERKLKHLFKVTWYLRDDVTRICVTSLIWVTSSERTCMQNSVVTGLMEMELSILISILTWIPWKKLNSQPLSTNLILRLSKLVILIYNSEEKREEKDKAITKIGNTPVWVLPNIERLG